MQRLRSDVWILEGRYLLLTLLIGVLDTHGETMPRLRLTIGCSLGSLEFDVCLSLCSLSDPVVVIHRCRLGVRAMNRICSTIQIYFWLLGSLHFYLRMSDWSGGSNSNSGMQNTCTQRDCRGSEPVFATWILNHQCLLFARLSDLFEGVLMRYAEVGSNCNMCGHSREDSWGWGWTTAMSALP